MRKLTQLFVSEDNQSCISWAKGDGSSKRSKHIELKYRYSKEVEEKGEIKIQCCPTDEMLADILTKPLPAVKHEALRTALWSYPRSKSRPDCPQAEVDYKIAVVTC